MKSIFKDTIFGLAVNYLSRNRLFAHQDVYDEELRQHYINSCEKMDASNDDKLEKGEEYILIDFLENDPDVSMVYSVYGPSLIHSGSAKLVSC